MTNVRVPMFVFGLLAVAVIGWLLHLLGPILMPFVLGAAMAYVGDPIVDRLERYRFSRTGGVIAVFVLFTLLGLGLLLVLLPLLVDQVSEALRRLPQLLDWVQNRALPAIGVALPEGSRLDGEGLRTLLLEHWEKVG
ncbi:MAG: AI-2E family transporter, partial [Oceanococcaceae bacterium]